MGMFSFLRKLFRRERPGAGSIELAAWDDIDSWLFPPDDMHNPALWDQYWYNQVSHGLGPPLFDMFISDETLIEVMSEHRLQRVLCAGNGISQEPRLLAAAGFEVTALDSSPLALRIADTWQREEAIAGNGIAGALQSSEHHASFVVGDVLNPEVCPGPYDLIIERRTLQLFSETERGLALDALLSRLQPEGVILSHCHDGSWRPPAKPFHPVKALLRDKGVTIWSGPPDPKPRGKVGWIEMSTG
jgi:hypothetical protein